VKKKKKRRRRRRRKKEKKKKKEKKRGKGIQTAWNINIFNCFSLTAFNLSFEFWLLLFFVLNLVIKIQPRNSDMNTKKININKQRLFCLTRNLFVLKFSYIKFLSIIFCRYDHPSGLVI
jgi:hypothetical protein